MKFTLTFLLLIFFVTPVAYSQKSNDVYVDQDGVMRWGNTKEEVKGFGVNYTVPFAYAGKINNVTLDLR